MKNEIFVWCLIFFRLLVIYKIQTFCGQNSKWSICPALTVQNRNGPICGQVPRVCHMVRINWLDTWNWLWAFKFDKYVWRLTWSNQTVNTNRSIDQMKIQTLDFSYLFIYLFIYLLIYLPTHLLKIVVSGSTANRICGGFVGLAPSVSKQKLKSVQKYNCGEMLF